MLTAPTPPSSGRWIDYSTYGLWRQSSRLTNQPVAMAPHAFTRVFSRRGCKACDDLTPNEPVQRTSPRTYQTRDLRTFLQTRAGPSHGRTSRSRYSPLEAFRVIIVFHRGLCWISTERNCDCDLLSCDNGSLCICGIGPRPVCRWEYARIISDRHNKSSSRARRFVCENSSCLQLHDWISTLSPST